MRLSFAEDCLYLNIYTLLEISNKEPVLVWIHDGGFSGGPFQGGSSEEVMYQPQHLVSITNMIVVTFNYRMGPLGFLSTADDAARGNYGLHDQIKALEWVGKYINKFGGDPKRVTLGGGISAAVLALSPKSQSLFHRVVVFGGSVLSPYSYTDHPYTSAVRLAESLGCSIEFSSSMVACLRQKSVSDLYKDEISPHTEELLAWAPVIDGEILTAPLQDMLQTTTRVDVPYMMAVTGDCGYEKTIELIEKLELSKDMTGEDFRHIFVPYVVDTMTPYRRTSSDVIISLNQEYNDYNVSVSTSPFSSAVALIGDLLYKVPFESEVQQRAQLGMGTYSLVFEHRSSSSQRFDNFVPNGLAQWYSFGIPLDRTDTTIPLDFSDDDKRGSVEIMIAVHAFAEKGDPNLPNISQTWRQYTSREPVILVSNFTDGFPNSIFQDNYGGKKVQFWNHFLPGYSDRIWQLLEADPEPYRTIMWVLVGVCAFFILLFIIILIIVICVKCIKKPRKTRLTKNPAPGIHAHRRSRQSSGGSSANRSISVIEI